MAEKKERFVPIGVKLIGIVSAILAVSLVGMTVIATKYFSDEVEGNAKDNSLANAKGIAQQVGTEFRALLDRGRLIASALRGGISLQGTGDSVVQSLMGQDSSIAGVCYAGREGGAFAPKGAVFNEAWLDSSGILSEEALGTLDEAALEPAFGGKTLALNLSARLGKGLPLVALAEPYAWIGETEASEVLVVFITLERVLKAFSSNELYQSFMTDGEGVVVASQDEAAVVAAADLGGSPFVQRCLSSPVGAVQSTQLSFEEGGVAYFGSYATFLGGQLAAFSQVEREKALAAVYAIQNRNILITVLFLCVAILLLYFFSRTLTTPIKRLVEGTAMIRQGEFDLKIPVKGHDELGRLTGSFSEMGAGLAEKERIQKAFGQFVNPEIARKAASGEIALGGEDKNVAIFFSDIRFFTEISEKLSPAEVVEFLNDYMTRMVECVRKTQGEVDKFIGDAVMAVWGAPLSHGNDVQNAVDGALLMRTSLMEFNQGRGGDRKPVIKIGCGINCGKVIAGQIGSTTKMSYTVIGDAVNLASRIEALNKPFRTDILISEEAWLRVEGLYRVEPMKKIKVKGKSEPQQIYAVVGREGDPACPASLDELRKTLGIPTGVLGDVDPEAHEEKYEILE